MAVSAPPRESDVDAVDRLVELPVDEHDGDLGGEQRTDVGLRAVRGHDDTGGLLGDGEVDVARLLGRLLVGIAQHDGELARHRRVLDAAGNRREEHVLDVGDDQQPQARALPAQVAGDVVGPVPELLGRRPDTVGEDRVDRLVVVQRPRHGRHRYVCLLGHVDQLDHQAEPSLRDSTLAPFEKSISLARTNFAESSVRSRPVNCSITIPQT